MSGLSKEQARRLIEDAMASLLDPKQDAESLSRYFAPDYVQDVDGKRLDFNGFIDHARTLKATLRRGHATIEKLVVDGDTSTSPARSARTERGVQFFAFASVFAFFARSMPSITSLRASAASPQRTILTHLLGSRSL